MEDKKLTTQDYWENYYSSNHANKKHILNVCSFYDQFWDLFIGKEVKHSLIEIGGFPGRYLAYLSHKYNLFPTCLDYNSDTSQVLNSFEVMGVEDFKVLQKDFTEYSPEETYDYVMSNGFIEHFENYDEILDLHVNYMHENSKLLIMIPNMRGHIRFYKYLVDARNLKIHNLKSMRLSVFKRFAVRNNLKINYLGYYGGFPLGVHQELNFPQKIIHKGYRLFFKYFANKYLMKYPTKFFSSSIVAIFEFK